MDLPLNGAGHLVIRDVEEGELFRAFFTVVFTSKELPSGIPGPRDQWDSLEQGGLGLLSVAEDQVWEHLKKLDAHSLWALMACTRECRQSWPVSLSGHSQ